jgi:hypothetical protein
MKLIRTYKEKLRKCVKYIALSRLGDTLAEQDLAGVPHTSCHAFTLHWRNGRNQWTGHDVVRAWLGQGTQLLRRSDDRQTQYSAETNVESPIESSRPVLLNSSKKLRNVLDYRSTTTTSRIGLPTIET